MLDHPVRQLSKGNRQKVGLVLAFMHQPELLVLDEPTSGLDPLVQAEFERLVREVVAEGRTVFLSSHDLDEVQRLADRIAIVRNGRLITADTVEGFRRRAPKKVRASFPARVDLSLFTRLDGVSVRGGDGSTVDLDVTGDRPALALIAEHSPLDVVSRHADLEELFLDLYRAPAQAGPSAHEVARA